MKIRDTVFGSKAEQEAYTAIETQWAWRFNVYLSLPFAMVVDFADATLSDKQREYLLKTSLDFTLTDKIHGKPLLSVEFDGLGSGFSRDGVYQPERDTSEFDQYRKLKLDLKLKLAQQAGYPLVVVAYDETNQIDREEQLTVLDGVIGQVLAKKWFASQGRKMIADVLKAEGVLSDAEDADKPQEAVWVAELFSKLLWNPVFRRAADFAEEVVRKGLIASWQHEYLTPRFEPTTVKVRVSTEFQGSKFVETVELRNTNVDDVDVMEIAQSIARYRVFARVLKAAGLPLPPDTRNELHAAMTEGKS